MKAFRTNRIILWVAVAALTAAMAILIGTGGDAAKAQQITPPTRQAGATDTKKVLIDPADTVILLLDHQNGLFQTVKDVPVAELRTNTLILAKLAKLAKVPLITTASEPNGPNGPLMQ